MADDRPAEHLTDVQRLERLERQVAELTDRVDQLERTRQVGNA